MKKTLLFLTLLWCSSYLFAQVDLQNGLIASYPFNGNACDESGNGYNGTVSGATLTTDRFGNANSAYSFDGISSYIQFSADGLPTQNRTVSFWFYTTTIPYGYGVLSYGGLSCNNAFLFIINNPGSGGNNFDLQGHCNTNQLSLIAIH